VGVLLIAAIAFCLFWRRRKRAKGTQAQAELATSSQDPAHMNAAASSTTPGQNEYYGHWDNNNNNNTKTIGGDGSTIHTAPSPGPPPMAEMPPGPARYEMDAGPHVRAEMPGN
jgi:hypothetical protein